MWVVPAGLSCGAAALAGRLSAGPAGRWGRTAPWLRPLATERAAGTCAHPSCPLSALAAFTPTITCCAGAAGAARHGDPADLRRDEQADRAGRSQRHRPGPPGGWVGGQWVVHWLTGVLVAESSTRPPLGGWVSVGGVLVVCSLQHRPERPCGWAVGAVSGCCTATASTQTIWRVGVGVGSAAWWDAALCCQGFTPPHAGAAPLPPPKHNTNTNTNPWPGGPPPATRSS